MAGAVIECRAINPFQVHVRLSTNTGYTFTGKLVGWGPKGLVLKNGMSYTVREGDGRIVAHHTESDWTRYQWDYHTDYCCRK